MSGMTVTEGGESGREPQRGGAKHLLWLELQKNSTRRLNLSDDEACVSTGRLCLPPVRASVGQCTGVTAVCSQTETCPPICKRLRCSIYFPLIKLITGSSCGLRCLTWGSN